MRKKVRRSPWGGCWAPPLSGGRRLPSRKGLGYPSRRPCSLPGDENRAAGVAHDPCRIGAEQVILHGRPVRSDDHEIGLGFLSDSQNLGIDTGAVRDENVGLKVGSIRTADCWHDHARQQALPLTIWFWAAFL